MEKEKLYYTNKITITRQESNIILDYQVFLDIYDEIIEITT